MKKKKSKAERFYVVFAGAYRGVYESWEQVRHHVEGYSHSYHKSYASLEEAKKAFYQRKKSNDDPNRTYRWSHPRLKSR